MKKGTTHLLVLDTGIHKTRCGRRILTDFDRKGNPKYSLKFSLHTEDVDCLDCLESVKYDRENYKYKSKKSVQAGQEAPYDSDQFVSDVFGKIDWKWIGITYIATMLYFGTIAIVKKDWTVLVGGVLIITCVVMLACLRVLWCVSKNKKS